MFDLLIEKSPALLIPIIGLLGTAIVFTVWIIAHYWHGIRRQELEASMKQDMLTRGFVAEDIERVLVASSSRTDAVVPAGKETISDNEYYLVEKMLEEGHAIEDIERLVRAFKEGKNPSGIRVEA